MDDEIRKKMTEVITKKKNNIIHNKELNNKLMKNYIFYDLILTDMNNKLFKE